MSGPAPAPAPADTGNGSDGGGNENQDRPITQADLDAFAGRITSKYNSELGTLRKRLEAALQGEQSKGRDDHAQGRDGQNQGPTFDDLDAAIELGELKAGLPKDVRDGLKDDLEGLSFAEKARIYRLTAKALGIRLSGDGQGGSNQKGQRRDADEAGARRPKQQVRGEPPAPRESAPYPTTKAEFAKLKSEDPARYLELLEDDAFDPFSLT